MKDLALAHPYTGCVRKVAETQNRTRQVHPKSGPNRRAPGSPLFYQGYGIAVSPSNEPACPKTSVLVWFGFGGWLSVYVVHLKWRGKQLSNRLGDINL
jgi:hypothetical protein